MRTHIFWARVRTPMFRRHEHLSIATVGDKARTCLQWPPMFTLMWSRGGCESNSNDTKPKHCTPSGASPGLHGQICTHTDTQNHAHACVLAYVLAYSYRHPDEGEHKDAHGQYRRHVNTHTHTEDGIVMSRMDAGATTTTSKTTSDTADTNVQSKHITSADTDAHFKSGIRAKSCIRLRMWVCVRTRLRSRLRTHVPAQALAWTRRSDK